MISFFLFPFVAITHHITRYLRSAFRPYQRHASWCVRASPVYSGYKCRVWLPLRNESNAGTSSLSPNRSDALFPDAHIGPLWPEPYVLPVHDCFCFQCLGIDDDVCLREVVVTTRTLHWIERCGAARYLVICSYSPIWRNNWTLWVWSTSSLRFDTVQCSKKPQ